MKDGVVKQRVCCHKTHEVGVRGRGWRVGTIKPTLTAILVLRGEMCSDVRAVCWAI